MLINISTRPRDESANLVDQLLECHSRIRHFVDLAHRVATLNDTSEEQIAEACAAIALYFQVALPLHVADEEHSILPRLIGRDNDVDRALETMARQHHEHEADLKTFLEAVEAVAEMPRNAAHKSRLADATTPLDKQFSEHLALEESKIFPALRKILLDSVESEIIAEFRDRRSIAQPNPAQKNTKGPS